MKNMWRVGRLVVALSLQILWSGFSNTAYSGTPAIPFRIEIYPIPRIDGGTTFEVNVPASFTRHVRLPNGQLVTTSFPVSGITDLVYGSFSEMKTALVGTWTIEQPMTPLFPQERHTFELSDFPEDVFAAVPPSIISPTEGSIVPATFLMNWAWPSGVTPPTSRAYQVRRFGPGAARSFRAQASSPADYLSIEVSALHGNGTLAHRIELLAGSFDQEILSAFVSDVTPQQDDSRFTYFVQPVVYSFSKPVQVFGIVPEPASWILFAAASTALACHRRRSSLSNVSP